MRAALSVAARQTGLTSSTGLVDRLRATWNTSLILCETGGTLASTTVEARIGASAQIGSVGGGIFNSTSGAPPLGVTVSGTVTQTVPAIGLGSASLNLGTTTTGTAGTIQSYTIDGVGLNAPITITSPPYVEISGDGGRTWTTTLTLAETGGSVPLTTIDVRISATAPVGSISGNIANICRNVTTAYLPVSGVVTARGNIKGNSQTSQDALNALAVDELLATDALQNSTRHAAV